MSQGYLLKYFFSISNQKSIIQKNTIALTRLLSGCSSHSFISLLQNPFAFLLVSQQIPFFPFRVNSLEKTRPDCPGLLKMRAYYMPKSFLFLQGFSKFWLKNDCTGCS
uniref:Uncharacterized protein n=1 Tax=Utricularia reniformis TaxID=192314 RepID=A0A1Y0B391_9LAMI|nr:hypothetical protein AEK19_MT1671 [Utricularia reniformis]ART31853.1 hypothetical protein AEK19_MT1671 [Utricularia reniformis]